MTVDLIDDVGCDEAGAALLGAVLHGSAAARDAVAQLTVEDFTCTRQRAVMEAIIALIGEGVPIDPVTALGQMRSQGVEVKMPAGVDAGVYLVELMGRALDTDPTYHVEVVRQQTLRRDARKLGQRAAQAAGSSSLVDLVTMIRNDTIRLMAAAKRAGVQL